MCHDYPLNPHPKVHPGPCALFPCECVSSAPTSWQIRARRSPGCSREVAPRRTSAHRSGWVRLGKSFLVRKDVPLRRWLRSRQLGPLAQFQGITRSPASVLVVVRSSSAALRSLESLAEIRGGRLGFSKKAAPLVSRAQPRRGGIFNKGKMFFLHFRLNQDTLGG